MKVTTFDQIRFLKRLYTNDLPFKIEDINTLKEIMIDEKTKILQFEQKQVGKVNMDGILDTLKLKMMFGFLR